MTTIRPETPDDHGAIRSVVAAAFPTDAESRLVDAIRASDRFVPELSLVAVEGGEVVGHVMISSADLDDSGTRHRVALLAPIAVHPDHQGRGIGTELLRASLARAGAMGEPMVLLEGSPRYYGARGFEHSAAYGITMDLPDWAPAEAAQIHRLSGYDPAIKGRLVLPEAFAGLD